VEYLGWHIYLTESGKVIRKVKQQTKYKYKRKLKYFQRAYADGNIELEEINQVLSSYRVPSRVMRKLVCRLWLNEVSQQ